MSWFRNKWAGGAQSTFFHHGVQSETPWSSTFRSVAFALVGIATVNQICRGNIWGEVTEESEVYVPLPVQRRSERQISTTGFVGSESDQDAHR
jgi:hypothetical protein